MKIWLRIILCSLAYSGLVGHAHEVFGEERTAGELVASRLDGPYVYRSSSDAVEVLGWIEEKLEGDQASFVLCSKKTITVKVNLLAKVSRSCPDKGRGLGYAYKDEGLKIVVPASSSVDFKEKKFTVDAFPKGIQSVLTLAKPGEPVGFAYTSGSGAVKLGIFENNSINIR